jgi:hypothetical protein
MPSFHNMDRPHKMIVCVLSAGLLFAGNAFVTVETETFTANGKTMTVRASSKLAGGRMYALPNMFDNDSTTCWIEGTQDTRAGRWLDVTYSEKKRYKGLVVGAGCRKDFISLEDFSVPTKVRIKLDEKPAFEYTMDWIVGQGTLSHEDEHAQGGPLVRFRHRFHHGAFPDEIHRGLERKEISESCHIGFRTDRCIRYPV